ncbi:hypothetical protein [Streptomyces pilosus]|uniref:Uncharacterized protein n=1 Tax=Streptomyces pilosus TaxID=28893 RepID=A0A918C4D2_9ACTN|nr:hypothetical protein [Streptomyces pilosus]GGR04245.1 hypothetical protein GCM10010280_60270 [Streptomyces pilosus]GGV68192.1 hypothetical protein GCM10010261_61710 [Streptomyces pilosus]
MPKKAARALVLFLLALAPLVTAQAAVADTAVSTPATSKNTTGWE